MYKCGWYMALLVALACPALPQSLSADESLRIGLVRYFKGIKQATALASSDYTITRTGTSDVVGACTNLEPAAFDFNSGQVLVKLINGQKISVDGSVTVTPKDKGGFITVDAPGRSSKQYRGSLEISAKNGALQLVSIITLEDYLIGVLAGEMPAFFPAEALKAQAIAARTYTIRGRNRHAADGYDLCDNVHCHVYDGAQRETPAYIRAVAATAGQILTYQGQVASIMYASDCGGVTECYSQDSKSAIPYLISVIEPEGVAHRTWEKIFTLDEISKKLMAAGVKEAEGLQSISIYKTTSSGRALLLTVCGDKGQTTVGGNSFRWAIGGSVIPSTLFTIESCSGGKVTLKGKGFGHGIGMCQVGAGELAKPPFNYTCAQILAHYFPGTTLTNRSCLSQAKVAPPPDSESQER